MEGGARRTSSATAEATEDEQLPVRLREGGGAGGDRDDDEAQQVDGPLAQPDDEPTSGGREGKPEERERADDDRARRGAHAETLRELRQHGCDEPEAERDDEGGGDEDPDLTRDLHLRAGFRPG